MSEATCVVMYKATADGDERVLATCPNAVKAGLVVKGMRLAFPSWTLWVIDLAEARECGLAV